MRTSLKKEAYRHEDQGDLWLIKSSLASDRDRLHLVLLVRGKTVESERHLRLAPADQLGQRFAGACAMGPAQCAVTGVDPELADFGLANVGDVGRCGRAQAGPVVGLAALGLVAGVTDAGQH